MFKKIGPGVLIAAAFIGPGTVTACTLAGVGFGYALLWAMVLSIIATVVLQEMAARLGIITQKGLADVIKSELKNRIVRNIVVGVILSAIVLGNAAYEGGNIGGATLGLEAIFGSETVGLYPYLTGGLAFVLLFIGNYKLLEKVFVGLVILMSLSFLITAFITKPDLLGILKGMFVPIIPEESILTVIALVGTTV
ncbi:Nramp family divalent metal transporter, partial [bacterium]|nr:Nramp family divalent metal transporter [bacterium]